MCASLPYQKMKQYICISHMTTLENLLVRLSWVMYFYVAVCRNFDASVLLCCKVVTFKRRMVNSKNIRPFRICCFTLARTFFIIYSDTIMIFNTPHLYVYIML